MHQSTKIKALLGCTRIHRTSMPHHKSKLIWKNTEYYWTTFSISQYENTEQYWNTSIEQYWILFSITAWCRIARIWFCFPVSTLMLHCCINVTTPTIHNWLVVKPRFNFAWWQLISAPYMTSNMLASGGQILHSHSLTGAAAAAGSTVGDPADPRFQGGFSSPKKNWLWLL
jgi:hypothetical protein